MEEKIEWASGGTVRMKLFGSLEMPSTEERALQEKIRGIAKCLSYAVEIGRGTGEQATQTVARAKDLYELASVWHAGVSK